jgi:radical SAM superfamily enzyme YgiQ (UPF0313 family)
MAEKYGGAKCRHYSENRVIEELKLLSKRGAKMVCFTDEEFLGIDLSHAERFAKAVFGMKVSGEIDSGISFMASVSVRLIRGKSEEHFNRAKNLLVSLKRIGFNRLFLGIESGSRSQLKRYGKGVTPEDNEIVLRFLKDIGIDVDIGFIMFDPLMTFDELLDNIEFIKRNGLDRSSSRVIKEMLVLPGTPYEKMLSKHTGLASKDFCAWGYRNLYQDVRVREVLKQLDTNPVDSDESYTIQMKMRTNTCNSDERRCLEQNHVAEMNRLMEIVKTVSEENVDCKGCNHHSLMEGVGDSNE